MKIALILTMLLSGLAGSAQETTKAQNKKSKILTKYIWQNTDSSRKSLAPDKFIFYDEKDQRGFKGSFDLKYQGFVMGWEWADKKATSLILYLRYSATSWDTLKLNKIKLTDKLLTADFIYSNWGKPKSGTLRHFAAVTQEEANKETGELKAIDINRQ